MVWSTQFRRHKIRSAYVVHALAASAFAALLSLPAGAQHGWQDYTVVQEIRNWSYDNYTRVVIYTDKKLDYTVRELPADPPNNKPPRIYLDLSSTRIAPAVQKELPIDDGLLKRARIAQFNKTTARLVLDMESISRHQVIPFRDPNRVVIDIFGKKADVEPQIAQPKSDYKSQDPLADILGDSSIDKVKRVVAKTQPKTVVVDAGHGGKDPGAVGVGNIYEKDIVLAIANRVADKLRQSGHRVIQTRKNDIYLKLEERTGIANGREADLFVSIHANSAGSQHAYGIETYHLAPASDERARELAARENNVAMDAEMEALDELLHALNFSNKLHVSSALAQFVQQNLSTVIGRKYNSTFRDLGVKGAPFYVLVGTNMASVLVEVGFVSNPKEAKLLRSNTYREHLAGGIVGGINEYLKKLEKMPF